MRSTLVITGAAVLTAATLAGCGEAAGRLTGQDKDRKDAGGSGAWGLTVSWDAVTGPDLKEYRVHLGPVGTPVAERPLIVEVLADPAVHGAAGPSVDLPADEYEELEDLDGTDICVHVTAVTTAGVQSPASEPACLSL